MVQIKKKEGTGTHYRREGRKVKAYLPGDVMEVASTKTMKCFMDGFEKVKEEKKDCVLPFHSNPDSLSKVKRKFTRKD
jgi:hypothetical protein